MSDSLDLGAIAVGAVSGVGPTTAETLRSAGIDSAQELAKTSPDFLVSLHGFGESRATEVVAAAREKVQCDAADDCDEEIVFEYEHEQGAVSYTRYYCETHGYGFCEESDRIDADDGEPQLVTDGGEPDDEDVDVWEDGILIADGGVVRKHFSLIVDHPDDEKEGIVEVTGRRKPLGEKNERVKGQKYNRETGDYYDYWFVSLGYVDYDDEEDYRENGMDDAKRKLAEAEDEHLRAAGKDPDEVRADAEEVLGQ